MGSRSRFHANWRHIAIGAFTSIFMHGVAAAADSPEIEFDRAMQAYEQGRFHIAQARLQDAARGGHARAHEILGYMYLVGAELYPGVDRNRPLALQHLEAAALAGSTQAAFTLCAVWPRTHDLSAARNGCPERISQQVWVDKGSLEQAR